MDYTLKGINNWLPYSLSPRPYAIFRETVYSIMLRYLQNHPELHHIKAAVTLIFQYSFLFCFCFAVLQYRCVLYRLTTTLCVPLSVMDLEEFDMLSFHENHGRHTFSHEIFFFFFLACCTPSLNKNINGMEKA